MEDKVLRARVCLAGALGWGRWAVGVSVVTSPCLGGHTVLGESEVRCAELPSGPQPLDTRLGLATTEDLICHSDLSNCKAPRGVGRWLPSLFLAA